VQRERASQTPLLLLDTGGTFLKKPEDAGNAALLESTTDAMIEGLGKIGYDALNLGRIDLLLPSELLRRLAARAAFPVLSANIVDAAGKSPFTGWIVKEVGGLRVGLFGISGNQVLGLPELPGRDLTVQDPVVAARTAVSALRHRSDLVIALSQLGPEADARIAREVPGIDIILCGFTRQVTQTPRIEGATLLLQSGAKGMQLGRLGLQIVPGRAGAWTPRAAARGGEARVYDWTLVQLNTALPDHPALAALLERNREELRSRNLAEQAVAPPPPPAPANPAFVGAAACGACHPAQLQQWASSRHARALDALVRRRQDRNPECVRCHVTGYDDREGYRLGAVGGVDLGNVQCEACHGFGREHRGKGRIRASVPESICRKCHSTENSPTFKYEPYLRQLGEHAARYFTRSRGGRERP
jgi:hypothetical protein